MAKTTDEALEKIARANALADMLEVRLDVMESFSLAEIIGASTKPVIVTYRSKKEGGKGSANDETQTRYLLMALEAHADFVDVEYSMPLQFRHKIFRSRGGSQIIASVHLLNETPSKEKLQKIFRRLAGAGADVVKIVTRARAPEDNVRVLELIPQAQKLGVKITAFCMGPMGQVSRVFSYLMGGYLTFASLEEGEESAEGQIPVTVMKKMLRLLAK